MATSPPGWHDDPWNPSQRRWWDGATWTSATAPGSRDQRWFGSLPWFRWLIWLGVIGASGLVCFGMAESTARSRGAAWGVAGLCSIAALSMLAATLTLRRQRWLAALVLAGLIATTSSGAMFVTAAPAASRSCQGESDCDTSFGLALPILGFVFSVPALALTSAGWALARSRRRTTAT